MSQDDRKRTAALAAIELLESGMNLGVGTGSTVNHFIDALAGWRGRLGSVVSSSVDTTQRLAQLGIEVSELNDAGTLDLYVDGADEANAHLQLIKGGGGALTREKIIAEASRRFVCIIDDSKLVKVLGRFPLPVEVLPMARSLVARKLVAAKGRPAWREGFVTDNGNQILDVHHLDIVDPVALERDLNQIPGVVSVGLFARRPADLLLVADGSGVRQLKR
ncbi:MAG: ribose-5-phosphate isomerase RpiA [Steroidobacteraceae bacterium]|jgi:ribose 5-phosphate isomerase A